MLWRKRKKRNVADLKQGLLTLVENLGFFGLRGETTGEVMFYPYHQLHCWKKMWGEFKAGSGRPLGGNCGSLGCLAQQQWGWLKGIEFWTDFRSRENRMCWWSIRGMFIDYMFSFGVVGRGKGWLIVQSLCSREHLGDRWCCGVKGKVTVTCFFLQVLGLQFLCSVCSRSRFLCLWEHVRSTFK